LRGALTDPVRLTFGREPPQPAEYEILVSGRPSEVLLDASDRLRVLVIPYAGLPAPTREQALARPGLAVHNLHHNAQPTAEMAVALLLAAAKRLLPLDRALRRGNWLGRYRPSSAQLLEGKTVLILGHGAIGHRVARACWGLGMLVEAVHRGSESIAASGAGGGNRTGEMDAVKLHRVDELHQLLPGARALVICLPLTAATEGLIGAAELALLPPEAVLVNVSRGAVVDEAALYRALASGELHGAGLDVWWQYPGSEEERSATSPSAYPFHELDNVVMSPHRGGTTAETESRRMQHLARLLNAAAQGVELPNAVDVMAGY
jgi:phosphoglycerate dehydrogenase-like enzyme